MKRHAQCLKRALLLCNNANRTLSIRCLSTKEAIERRYHLFKLEQKRQRGMVGRIEKIEVNFKGVPKDCTFVMNKDISTPYDCARHMSEWHAESSALALLNESLPWDMHKPLSENCTLQLQTFNVPSPYHVNNAFWRSCSFVLGAMASVAFKDKVPVKLHSFPVPEIRSGSFVYDVDLPTLDDWKPTRQEMFTLSAEYVKVVRRNLLFERLDVSEDLALEMFKNNEHKSTQIPSIASANGKVTVYSMGEHVDISRGPMVGRTGLIGKMAVTAVHRIVNPKDESEKVYRFQGVALPVGVVMDHFAFEILTNRAKKLNTARSPFDEYEPMQRKEAV